ncbi:hypothetical protein [Burkholderia alba]|uniref:hypothetical protein n=1 Tax=Burkholderia alba TaxID=2683677 RepID=UPI002B056BD8|nr:hypothetical protein [Burkholderia alba]
MTPERFREIVDAYGAEPQRWPAPERADAQAWAHDHRREADALLRDAAGVDAWLASDPAVEPDAALVRRIVASAPVRPARPPVRSRAFGWPGAALAGLGIAGGLAGAFALSFFLVAGAARPAHDAPDSSYMTTGFGGSSADWSGE